MGEREGEQGKGEREKGREGGREGESKSRGMMARYFHYTVLN